MESKYCFKCKQVKDLKYFHKNPQHRLGFHDRCKICRKLESKDRYLKYKRKINRQNTLWIKNHPYHKRAINEKYRCKLKGLTEHFTWREWKALVIKQQKRCNVCKKKRSLEVDHIVPLIRNGSNMIDNIQGLCRLCNTRKGFSSGHNLKGNI